MEQKRYTSIKRMGHRDTIGMFEQGDQIVVTEKIDCSNASFTLDEQGDLQVFSRNVLLDDSNSLNGFYQWVHENIETKHLMANHVYFGEWLGNPHKVQYAGHEKQFFLFDVYSNNVELYLPFTLVEDEARILKINLVPVFYRGEFISFEHLEGFVGMTALGGKIGDHDSGEGIVVKNFSNQGFAKMVTDVFLEVHRGAKAYKKPTELGAEAIFVAETVTPARVEKIYYKLQDEAILAPDLQIEDMGNILKILVPAVEADILKEEAEMLPDGYDAKTLRKAVSKKVPNYIRKVIERA